MRRTYRSKKDDINLDHRNLISGTDVRSAVFDAFYIHNIKLNKKAISSNTCSKDTKVGTKKVRKRKYVKRIVNDAPQAAAQNSGEAERQSVCLTPDKSIHVNKAPDPFDLLLRSSPRITLSPMKEELFIKKKTIHKSSTADCADSERENSTTTEKSLCHNTSDVKSHRLRVEAEDKENDESISRIIKRMPHLDGRHKDSRFKSIKDKHRLTGYRNTPATENSPFCSTPFQLKYRCKSIFNVSPITRNVNDSPTELINTFNGSKSEDEDGNEPQFESITNKKSLLLTSASKGEGNRTTSMNLTIGQKLSCSLESKQLDMLSTSEVEPCYGFANPTATDNYINTDPVHLRNYLNEITESKKSTDQSCEFKNSKFEQFQDEISRCTNDCLLSESSIFAEKSNVIEKCASRNSSRNTSNGEFLYSDMLTTAEVARPSNNITYNHIKTNSCLINHDKCLQNTNLVVVVKKMDDSMFWKYYKKSKSTGTIRRQTDLFNNLANSQPKENYIELSNDSYNTECDSNSEEKENLTKSSNASYNTQCDNNLDIEESLIVLSNASYNTECSNKFYSLDNSSLESTSQGFDQNFEANRSQKEDVGISYVTTRRRHDIVDDTITILPDNSYSCSGIKADESAIDNNILELSEKVKGDVAPLEECSGTRMVPPGDESASDGIVSDQEDILLRDEDTIRNMVSATGRIVSHSNDNGSRERTDKRLTECDAVSGSKAPIALQPGKKWERSLSIYKRMTTIADSNHSLLDYEQTESKGRKYRQSVIDTMQMQKSYCSLHNEPINGRRSTFVCKPSRSTIKLVKENANTRASLCPTTAYEDLKGFLSDDCDDTIVDLSKLSIGESVHEVTVVEKFHESSRISTARDYVLRRCNQTEPLRFDECYTDTALKNCHKIGEGVYGEVFLWRARDGEARVLKVIPIAGDIKVNGEPQKGYHEIISEIVIAMELSALRAPIPDIEKRLDEGKELDAVDLHSVENATDIFNEVLAVRCVRGSYPARLLELWELYDECRGSDNDNPGALPHHQHYLVLELRNAGRDLESYTFTAADQAYAVLLQLAFGLAVAEEALQFEHRDLHWGNVLVSPTDQQYATFVVRGRVHRVLRRGVACVVIDYSLSRVSLRGAALYADLADDDDLFDAVGDRQFDVYRLMRDRLGNEWKNFEPYTNVLWLHYVADKMVTALRYERPATKLHRHYLARLRALRQGLLAHASAADFVLAHAHAHAAL